MSEQYFDKEKLEQMAATAAEHSGGRFEIQTDPEIRKKILKELRSGSPEMRQCTFDGEGTVMDTSIPSPKPIKKKSWWQL
jgi:hypothetical protein